MRGHTAEAKTAISIPDETFERVTRAARRLGWSRSELMTKAIVAYLDHLDSRNLSDEIDRVLDSVAVTNQSDLDVVEASRSRLAEIDNEW